MLLGGVGGSLNRIVTVPNIISVARILAIPVFLWWMFSDRIASAAVLLLVLGSTDWVDGYIARRFDQVTELGKALDPIADRLAIFAAGVGGLIAGVLPAWFFWPLVVREVILALLATYLQARHQVRITVRWLGKAATFLIYGAVPSFFLAAGDVAKGLFEPAAVIAGTVGLVLYWITLVQYLLDARRLIAEKTEG